MTNKEKALANDKRIEEMAIYVLTKGTTESLISSKGLANMNPDQLQQLQAEYMIKIQDKFSELKRLVKTGEFTMAELEDKVYEDYGVLETPRTSANMDILDKIMGGGKSGSSPFMQDGMIIKGFNQGK